MKQRLSAAGAICLYFQNKTGSWQVIFKVKLAIYIVLTPAEMHTVYKHFHAEMLYTKTLKVMCVLAFMHTVCVCVFSKDWCSQHLEFDYGHRNTAKSDVRVFMCPNGCLWAYEYLSASNHRFLWANRPLPTPLPMCICRSLILDTHMHTHTNT